MRTVAVVSHPRLGKMVAKTNTFKAQFADVRWRELASHELLRGLAVPRTITLSRADWLAILCNAEHLTVCTEYAGESLAKTKRTVSEAVGIWAFVAEQLVAFRRHNVIYTDVKLDNIVVIEPLQQVAVIDLEGCLIRQKSGRYKASKVLWTRFYAARDHIEADERSWRDQRVTVRENVLTHQLGALLLATLVVGDKRYWPPKPSTIPRALSLLRGAGLHEVAALAARCVDMEPPRRPADYEALFETLQRALQTPRADEARAIWARLRSPYARALARVRLAGPTNGTSR